MENPTKMCRLCSEVTYNNNFELLDNCRAGMLKIISLDLDLGTGSDLLICPTCLEDLQQLFNFKSTCLSNNDYLKTFLHSADSVKLSLEEIIMRHSGTVDGIKCEEEKVCRFCLEYRDVATFTKLDTVEEDLFLKDMLEKCLPEIDLSFTNNPLVCDSCMENLQNQFNFVMSCLNNCENLKAYPLMGGANTKYIKKEDESLKVDFKAIKVEGDGVSYIAIKKEEELNTVEEVEFHVKIEECLKSEQEYESELQSPSGENSNVETAFKKDPESIYTCTECSHQTNRRDSLELHYLTHKELTKCDKFMCEQCGFTTKWRSSLTKHYLLHQNPSDIPMFQCANCPYKAKYKKHLRRHCKLHMDIDRQPYVCQCCPFRTGDGWYFKQHNKKKHKRDVLLEKESFNCRKCVFKSPYKAELDKHMKKGHNVAKYSCNTCGYVTQKLCQLKDHMLKHKSVKEVNMYKCDKCDFQTRYKNSCRKHILLHEARKKPRKGRLTVKGEEIVLDTQGRKQDSFFAGREASVLCFKDLKE